jgi:hypothetical protein
VEQSACTAPKIKLFSFNDLIGAPERIRTSDP